MRRMMVAGNWKMHENVHEASLLLNELAKLVQPHRLVEVVLAPTMLTLQPLSREIDRRQFKLAAQNAYFKDDGAYTGEVSFAMLRQLADYCIIGHSERRLYFGEDNKMIRDKVMAAVRNRVTPILCVGETKQERDDKQTRRVLADQVTSALANLTSGEIEDIVIAYEPVWAISTFGGEIANPDVIERELNYIRKQIAGLYGEKASQSVRILYGGSVDDQTAGGYLAIDGCDGCLVGGASLSAHKFAAIVESAFRVQTKVA